MAVPACCEDIHVYCFYFSCLEWLGMVSACNHPRVGKVALFALKTSAFNCGSIAAVHK